MADIVERLESITRSFPAALLVGAGAFSEMLTPACGVGRFAVMDLAAPRLPPRGPRLAADDETPPLREGALDLIVSLLTLHHTNDLVGALAQYRLALKPDGLFIGVMFGEETLSGLRRAFYDAEAVATGGVSARVAPFASVRDLGAALQRAGFALPVADVDAVNVEYRDPFRLLRDLRGMGETSVLAARGRGLRRDVLAEAMSALREAGPVRFDLVTLTGWAPHASQQKPLKPGSATTSLEAALKEAEKTLKDS